MRLYLSLGFFSGIYILLVFLFQSYVLSSIGPGVETDALFAGMAIPQIVMAIISSSLLSVLVPLLSGEDKKYLLQTTWNFFITVGFFFFCLAALLFLSAHLWVPILFPGFSAEGKALTVYLARIQLVSLVFTALSGVLQSSHHATKKFIRAEMSPALSALICFGLLVALLPRYGIAAAAWLNVARPALQVMLMLPILERYHSLDLKDPSLKTAWKRIRPVLGGSLYYKTDPLADRFLSSLAPAGGLSLLYFGQQIYRSGSLLLNKAITAPMVPKLATLAKEGNWKDFRSTYRKRLFWGLGLVGLGLAFILLLGEPLLHAAMRRESDTFHLLWLVLITLAGLPVGAVSGQVLASAFYAKGNTVIPTKVGIAGFTMGIILKVAGFFLFGLLGIAAGTSIYYLLNAILMYVLLEKELFTPNTP